MIGVLLQQELSNWTSFLCKTLCTMCYCTSEHHSCFITTEHCFSIQMSMILVLKQQKHCFTIQLNNILVLEQRNTMFYHPTDYHSCVRTSTKHCFIILLNNILVLEQAKTLLYHPTDHYSCVRTSKNNVLSSNWTSFWS